MDWQELQFYVDDLVEMIKEQQNQSQ